jgi:hypothetical protein
MQIDKDTIVNFLKEKGQHQEAAQAAQELPATVDHKENADLLSRVGVDPKELLSKLPGGVGEKLGGLLDGK